ncbi:hypothetical protein TNCV_2498531 [Trichonephila clavipes]|nr:hypothetical protein TNCV_2498531 [Trichonephila clavipes]
MLWRKGLRAQSLTAAKYLPFVKSNLGAQMFSVTPLLFCTMFYDKSVLTYYGNNVQDNPDVALRYMEKAIVMADKAFLTPNDPIKKELFQQVIEMYRRLGSRYFEREDDFTQAKHSKSVFYYKRAAVLARKFQSCPKQARLKKDMLN